MVQQVAKVMNELSQLAVELGDSQFSIGENPE